MLKTLARVMMTYCGIIIDDMPREHDGLLARPLLDAQRGSLI